MSELSYYRKTYQGNHEKVNLVATYNYDIDVTFSEIDRSVFNPPDDEAKLWRYMNVSKYLNMLSTGTIWFSRSDLLGDPFEGSTTKSTKESLEHGIRAIVPEIEEQNKLIVTLNKATVDISIFSRCHIYVNGWHLSEYESAAMWQQYGNEFGISITTTMSRIKRSMAWSESIMPTLVTYKDYGGERIPSGNFLHPFVHKRRSFEHEKEVRLIILHDGESFRKFMATLPSYSELSASTQLGLAIPTDLEELIIEVYIDPAAPQWFSEAIEDVTRKMGFHFRVIQSTLADDPIY